MQYDRAHSAEHNSENRVKKIQTAQKLLKFQNEVLVGSLVPLSKKFKCTSLIFMRILWRHKGI